MKFDAYQSPQDASFERAANKVKRAYLDVFKSRAGQVVLCDLVNSYDVMRPSAVSADLDSYTRGQIQGQKDVILRILETIERDPVFLHQELNNHERDIIGS